MTTCERQRGFTLLEMIIVLGILGLLLGTAVPLVSGVVQADRRQEVRRELADIAAALESYWTDHQAFPATLTATDFVGVHLQPGVDRTATVDPFAAGANYRYRLNATAGTATVTSVGENGRNNNGTGDDIVVVVYASVPGLAKTWQRFRLIVEVLANHIEAGGSVAGPWPALRANLGLPAAYDADGFGTTMQWDEPTHALSSAGPDRTFGTADDITM